MTELQTCIWPTGTADVAVAGAEATISIAVQLGWLVLNIQLQQMYAERRYNGTKKAKNKGARELQVLVLMKAH